MRVGVMLRTIDEEQGIGIYTQNIMDKLLSIDEANEYVLFYRKAEFLGRYKSHANVEEVFVRAPHKLIWDQVSIPIAARKACCDLIFHTKFTVPFLTRCKTIMSIHGASWFVHPELYDNKVDLAYIKLMMPLYCKKADAIVSNSDLTRNDYIRLFDLPPEKIKTAHLGCSGKYRMMEDQATLDAIRHKYSLPQKFILSVVRYDPRKNFENLIASFRLLRSRIRCKLVVVGKECERYIHEFGLDSDGTIDDVVFTGWVDQADLPAMYNLARCMLFPSVYEEFGIPTCESMACGCPPVVSNTGALPEIVGEAGITVDPFSPREMADALHRLYTEDAVNRDYRERCLKRAQIFTWDNCARKTLEVINRFKESL